MEAIEFLKAAKRRYESNPNKYCDVIYFDDSNFETYVKDVEEWAREHPAKTRQSEFLKMFPTAELVCGCIDICPHKMCSSFSCPYPLNINFVSCDDCKWKYWNKEVE